jgi:hypothetical protein
MPWSGGSFTRTNGVNTGATLWAQDRDDGTKILATRHDTNDQDMADGINSTLEKSGSNAATGNLDIGSNRITLVADGTAKTDVATVNQIQSNGPAFQATDTGTANTYVIALTPAITAYAAGQRITFKAGAASTTASTLNVNTLGAKALKKLHDQDIASGDIETGSIVTAVYDGTNFQVTSQLASSSTTSPGGSDTQVQYNSSSAFAGSAHFTFDGTSATVANPLFLPDGSASAPALSNTGDTNTGLYWPGADQLGLTTAGAAGLLIDATGAVTKPLQPCVIAKNDSNRNNVTGDGTYYTTLYPTEIIDRNADFNGGTGTFTAPVTGVYSVSGYIYAYGIVAATNNWQIDVVTSNRTHSGIVYFATMDVSPTEIASPYAILLDMDASDTAYVNLRVNNGSKVVDYASNSAISFALIA